jgi:hypothetical protein
MLCLPVNPSQQIKYDKVSFLFFEKVKGFISLSQGWSLITTSSSVQNRKEAIYSTFWVSD